MRARRSCVFLVGLLPAALVGCGRAHPISSTSSSTPPPAAAQITITGTSVEGGHVVARYTLTQDGQGLSGAAAAAMGPTWTLAALGADPVSGVPAWESLLLTGSQTLASLPVEGPGTPPAQILAGVKQPGSETTGTVQDLGGGAFSYTYAAALPQGFDATRTVRVGVWLSGTAGTPSTSSTFDFVPGGGAVQGHELVVDADCNRCHGVVQAHGGFRTGTRLCVTCHTWQNADPDTVDPAAPAGATAATNPNPLDLGRLVHRIHRGKALPTLYDASTGDPVPGQKYSVVGFRSAETVYGQVVNRTDNQQPAVAVAQGVGFPQELRNCTACHGGAAQGDQHLSSISRRTCGGCHPDVWFQASALPTGDLVHTPHPAGPQADDTRCAACHLPSASSPTVPADITQIHVAPHLSPRWNGLTARIVGVSNLKPGQPPTVLFTLSDRDGTPSPLGSPTPATDAQSPVPRALGSVTILLSGPTTPDYQTGNAPLSASVPLTTAADAGGQFSYTFTKPIPANATGTWAVGLEARRGSATDPGAWPFTGESLNEWADNPVEYVDVATGTFPGGAATVRRQVIDRARCEACHDDLTVHGDLRHNPEYCLLCHSPDATDWSQRPKAASGNVDLSKTFDAIEERSIHFKVLIHRIHTGDRTGSAELDLARPHVVYGFRGSVNFLDDVRFPGDLARCSLCHAGTTYRIESVPPGAQPTVANETATLVHKASVTPVAGEASMLPVTAACMGCHDTGAAQAHAATNTIGGKEQCAVCHGRDGFMSVDQVHGLTGG
jgi:OmcA/MtrC family decaheme c-type cytochrome